MKINDLWNETKGIGQNLKIRFELIVNNGESSEILHLFPHKYGKMCVLVPNDEDIDYTINLFKKEFQYVDEILLNVDGTDAKVKYGMAAFPQFEINLENVDQNRVLFALKVTLWCNL